MAISNPHPSDDHWDDSLLLRSWNGALAEYKKYHGIAARGEDAEALVRAAEELEKEQKTGDGVVGVRNGHFAEGRGGHVEEDRREGMGAEAEDGLEDGELLDEDDHDPTIRGPEGQSTFSAAETKPGPSVGQKVAEQLAGASKGGAGGGPDEAAMKNLMMAWYYAGYYTGFHEGQQSARPAP